MEVEAASTYEDLRADARANLANSGGGGERRWVVPLAFFSFVLILYVPYGFGLYKLITALT